MLAAGLGNTPAPQTFLDNLPLLFRTAFHLCFTTHAASSFGGPYPTLGRRSVLEGWAVQAHIKPYSNGGVHVVNNGLLLRQDIHTV